MNKPVGCQGLFLVLPIEIGNTNTGAIWSSLKKMFLKYSLSVGHVPGIILGAPTSCVLFSPYGDSVRWMMIVVMTMVFFICKILRAGLFFSALLLWKKFFMEVSLFYIF